MSIPEGALSSPPPCLSPVFRRRPTAKQKYVAMPPRIANSFSPNDDGNNDVFYIRGGPFLSLEVIVYDAWGVEIFKTTDPVSNVENGWDGTQNGKQTPIGVYVYTVVATTLDGKTYDYSGKINLFR